MLYYYYYYYYHCDNTLRSYVETTRSGRGTSVSKRWLSKMARGFPVFHSFGPGSERRHYFYPCTYSADDGTDRRIKFKKQKKKKEKKEKKRWNKYNQRRIESRSDDDRFFFFTCGRFSRSKINFVLETPGCPFSFESRSWVLDTFDKSSSDLIY